MDILRKFKNVRTLVVGDVMLDRFWWGDVTRISPEAPVPVVSLKQTSVAPGGAANVAANVAALGASPTLLGCVGTDAEGVEVINVVSSLGISGEHLITAIDRKTTVKTRVIAHSQQVVRVDQETVELLSQNDQRIASSKFSHLLSGVDAVAISDYAKGFLSDELLRRFLDLALERQLPIVVDPKGRDFSRYRGATVLTPNRREAVLACNLDDNARQVVGVAGKELCDRLGFQAVLITEGEDGMTLFENGEAAAHFPACAREVYDVTGAGDTVTAAIAVSLGAGYTMKEAAQIANVSAGLVVEKIGTAVVTIEALDEALAGWAVQAAQ